MLHFSSTIYVIEHKVTCEDALLLLLVLPNFLIAGSINCMADVHVSDGSRIACIGGGSFVWD